MAAGIRAKEDNLSLLRYVAWLQRRTSKYTGTHSLKIHPRSKYTTYIFRNNVTGIGFCFLKWGRIGKYCPFIHSFTE